MGKSKSLESKAVDILKGLTPEEEDALYRAIWKKHVIKDIESHLEDIEETLTDDQIEQAADLYVYDGEYDCNLSYWVNIENVIEQVKEN